MYHIINAQVNNVTVPYACWLLWWAYYIVNNVTKFLHFWIDVLDEPTLQLKRWNLRALENETHMKALILNTACHSPRTGSPSSLSLSLLSPTGQSVSVNATQVVVQYLYTGHFAHQLIEEKHTGDRCSMIGVNRQLVTNEPVEFVK